MATDKVKLAELKKAAEECAAKAQEALKRAADAAEAAKKAADEAKIAEDAAAVARRFLYLGENHASFQI